MHTFFWIFHYSTANPKSNCRQWRTPELNMVGVLDLVGLDSKSLSNFQIRLNGCEWRTIKKQFSEVSQENEIMWAYLLYVE